MRVAWTFLSLSSTFGSGTVTRKSELGREMPDLHTRWSVDAQSQLLFEMAVTVLFVAVVPAIGAQVDALSNRVVIVAVKSLDEGFSLLTTKR